MVLTGDAQALETRHLGFTISPHEECGVEEAVRIVEAHGGSSAVLTLGPPEAEEQLLSPAITWFHILNAVLPGKYTTRAGSPVFNHYTVEPNGQTLEEIAVEHGVW